MMKSTLLFFLLLISAATMAQKVRVQRLLCNGQANNPIGIDAAKPTFSWQLYADIPHVKQTAYRILVADNPALLARNKGNIWDSRKVVSDESIQILYAGKTLHAATLYYWKVMVWNNGVASDWSEPASWQSGLYKADDWKKAQWIGYEAMPDNDRIVPALHSDYQEKNRRKDVLPLLRKDFTPRKPLARATVFICGLGQFDLHLNGKKVGQHFLDPGWTKYDQQALYVTFDVTDQLQSGQNTLGVMLGNGFFFIPGDRYRKLTGAYGYPQLICRLYLQYRDGSADDIVSDPSWKAAPGPVTFSSIYGGEDYNATLHPSGWDQPGFNDSSWRNAVVVKGTTNLQAQTSALATFDQFSPVTITQPRPGVWLYDMGQNASAIPRLRVKGPVNAVVKLTPAELLTPEGVADQKPVGSPVYFNYTLKGDSVEEWQPQFMYYGFRYIQVEGAVPEGKDNPRHLPVIQQLTEIHTRNEAITSGQFHCSNELFNQTFRLIDWAIRSNMASVFTDCPHREKLGWLEQAHLVGSSIRYIYNIEAQGRKTVQDMILAQTAEGLVPDIAPEYVVFEDGFRDSPEWGSNGIIFPYYLYQWYGDKRVLEESYEMMTRYVAYLEQKSDHHILRHGLGDWYDIGPDFPGESQLTPKGITATAMYYYDLAILAKVAGILGRREDAQRYETQSAMVKAAYNKAFFNDSTKQYGTGSQAANAMSVYMGLVEPENKAAVVDNIIADVRAHNNSLTAGDIGYRYLLRVLDEAGHSDVIYDMNSRADVPGYGLQLAKGATALTESWQAHHNASNNHFMLGHLMEWFYTGLAGIRAAPGSVAFRDMEIRPEVVGDVTSAEASYESPYGLISSKWRKEASDFYLEVQVPGNARATIYLPASYTADATMNGQPLTKGYKDGHYVIDVDAGKYSFTVTTTPPANTSAGSYAGVINR
ncbi:MAG: family 78 glycoside hydrolase catalytic domain [Chitinophaga sp.]|uniref:family 78 glycoside hydrolase catalytic domain n=1 Tax=Chitinophaga sp. TaxID=1869181 RepID=UPI001B18F61D|nr:family 78 glycoside hydrolase catalytic domain [Chitinophaga sp.]MBO9727326.1 family 78 glycoside hydrolase catalytic domain [Chitinophaga sp.]